MVKLPQAKGVFGKELLNGNLYSRLFQRSQQIGLGSELMRVHAELSCSRNVLFPIVGKKERFGRLAGHVDRLFKDLGVQPRLGNGGAVERDPARLGAVVMAAGAVLLDQSLIRERGRWGGGRRRRSRLNALRGRSRSRASRLGGLAIRYHTDRRDKEQRQNTAARPESTSITHAADSPLVERNYSHTRGA